MRVEITSHNEELILREPTKADLSQIFLYREEFLESGDSMDGTSNLSKYNDMEEWFQFISLSSQKETCRADWVPDTQYIFVRKTDNRIVGMLDIRDELNEECRKYYGHIGYSIRKSERRKGYATLQLKAALEICKQKKMDRILITCDRENIASVKTIITNGGSLEDEIFDPNDNTMTQRYWIFIREEQKCIALL